MTVNETIAHQIKRARPYRSWIVIFAILLHWSWGVLLLSSRAPQRVTAIATIDNMGLANGGFIPVLYLSVAFLALIGLAAPRLASVIFLMPQQIVLLASATGAVTAMLLGQYADGVIRPRTFIIADQMPAVLLAALHILSTYEKFLTTED